MRVYLRTFGCRANHYDSEAARALIESSGGAIVATPEEADIALFNSCAVTHEAEADLRQQIRHAERRQPRIRSVVMGCAAALDGRRPGIPPLRALPSVDAVVAGADPVELAGALGVAAAASPRAARQSTTRAVLRIQDGCDEHCTFCTTRIARGISRSRSVAEIVSEARALATFHPEIVITGINIASYGADTGTSLGAVVTALLDSLPATRFRLSSLEPTLVDAAIASLLREGRGQLAPFLHAPLQSGSARLLRRMGRHWYSPESYVDAVLRIVDGREVFGLSADIIVGFPGETDADHRATVHVVERLSFTALHVFPFSPRPGTAAARLAEQVPPAVRRERSRELRELAARKTAQYRRSRSGGTADVIVVDGGSDRRGVTEDLLTVRIADRALPRGTRFDAVLAETASDLIALAAEAIVH